MGARIQKWGNSLALRIPNAFADEAGLQNEMSVEVSLADGISLAERSIKLGLIESHQGKTIEGSIYGVNHHELACARTDDGIAKAE